MSENFFLELFTLLRAVFYRKNDICFQHLLSSWVYASISGSSGYKGRRLDFTLFMYGMIPAYTEGINYLLP